MKKQETPLDEIVLMEPFLEVEASRARSDDPETSHDCAEVRGSCGYMPIEIFQTIKADDLSTKEIGHIVGLPRDNVSPWMKPLETSGFLERTKKRRDGCILWTLLPGGHKVLTAVMQARKNL